MKKYYAAIFFLFLSKVSLGQITIGTSDFAVGGDTIRVSLTNLAPINTSLATNGANAVWDYSALQPTSQDVDSFLSIGSTGAIYSIYFANFPFNTNRANVAARGVDLSAAGGAVPITDVYNFFYNSSSSYKQVGFGANLSGVSTPVPYGNKDIVYAFPCNFGNQDSCDSDYSITIPSLGHADGHQHRVNHVDGWGTLITPFGTFNALRVVSELSGKDSLYLDTLGFGFSFPRAKTREYKWLSTNGKIPVLQINTNVNGLNEVITSIKYRDIYRDLTVGIQNHSPVEAKVYPNPSNGEVVYINLNNFSNGKWEVAVYSMNGSLLRLFNKTASQGKITLNELKDIAPGYYTISLKGEAGVANMNWIKK
ncbi:MAG: T9SS type A sorting domain-containing protein [Bacteroidota bacterium]